MPKSTIVLDVQGMNLSQAVKVKKALARLDAKLTQDVEKVKTKHWTKVSEIIDALSPEVAELVKPAERAKIVESA